MAVAARTDRAAAVRARVQTGHTVGTRGSAADARAMVKRTAPVAHLVPQRQLALVPKRTRNARLIAVFSVVVFGLMLGAAAFQTQLARRQLTLDTLDRQIVEGRDRYEVLRRERAELRSPGRLVVEATALGMEPASQTEFVQVNADDVAAAQRTGAGTQDDGSQDIEAYADAKAQAQGQP